MFLMLVYFRQIRLDGHALHSFMLQGNVGVAPEILAVAAKVTSKLEHSSRTHLRKGPRNKRLTFWGHDSTWPERAKPKGQGRIWPTPR